MLEVQKYLQGGKTHADLTAELGIKTAFHESKPIVILNYDQIESPKTHPIVRECRGLILRSDSHDLVGRAFFRFFNWGEVQDEMPLFDFSDFVTYTKEDGSLVLIYHFDGEWHANTRGSFALDNMQFCEFTWRQGFADAMKLPSIADFQCDRTNLTFVCEYCSPFNKVVRRYPDPKMYLLSAFDGERELHWDEVDELAKTYGFERPTRHHYHSIEEIEAYLQQQATDDPTFEGVVICDKNGRRWKIKNATYLALHRLKGEGDNLFNPKHLIPFILAGEESELLVYFPEVEETFYKYKAEVDAAYAELESVWTQYHAIEGQKEFALAIVGKTPFTGILFNMRKLLGVNQTVADLKRIWRDSPNVILKQIFDK